MVPMPKVSDTHKRILIICGPTASGKTALAAALAKRLDGELVNADSRQMYRGLDIIAGKDTDSGSHPVPRGSISVKGETYPLVTYETGGVPIWLYDVAATDHPVSISHFRQIAQHIITDILRRGKLPIVVGGTGFYLSSLVRPIETLHVPQNDELRVTLANDTLPALQRTIAEADVSRWEQMNESDRNNPRRLIRAIEIAEWKRTHGAMIESGDAPFDAIWIGVKAEGDVLERRIRERVKQRMESGAVDEATALLHVSEHVPAASAIGLPILARFIRGELTREEEEGAWVREEVRYAKRQMVWFAKQRDIRWFPVSDGRVADRVEKLAGAWYTRDRYAGKG